MLSWKPCHREKLAEAEKQCLHFWEQRLWKGVIGGSHHCGIGFGELHQEGLLEGGAARFHGLLEKGERRVLG